MSCSIGQGAGGNAGRHSGRPFAEPAVEPRAAVQPASQPAAASRASRVRAPRISAAVRCVMLTVVGLVLGLGIYRFVAVVLAGDALPMPFGFGVATVMSGSMSPALEVDDLVIVQAQDGYAVGDVVVYQAGRSLVTHRVIAREGGLLTTQGDANNAPDEPIAESAVKGVVALRIPLLGAVVSTLKTPAAIVIIVLGSFALLALSSQAEQREQDAQLSALRNEVTRLRAETAKAREAAAGETAAVRGATAACNSAMACEATAVRKVVVGPESSAIAREAKTGREASPKAEKDL
ncbi:MULTISPECIES: signal peptidase I [unclassified Adlercreutzia]|uniref:signal peptidase I n=1 Tax=unclassified Adlercreutzia TaxID=2636013 RepID=UPI0013ECD85A|nr:MULTISPECIES: signal peptidase I [unclassified Adlercreutzia]